VFEFYPEQYRFVACEEPQSVFVAGIGSGKTLAGAVKALMHATPNTLGMVVSPTYGMLRDSTLRTFKDIGGEAIYDFNKNEMTAVMRGGAEILFRSADDPDKLRGPNANWAWIDEGGLTRKDTYEIVIGRLRAGAMLGDLWVTTTPKGKLNWVYAASQKMKVFKATTLDNPFVSDDWKQSLLDTYTGMFLRQEVYADFVQFEGLIYNMFDATVHVKRQDLSKYTGYGLAIDEGYTNPAVILKIYFDNDGNYHVAEEWYKRGKLQSEVVEETVKMAGAVNPEIIVDASAAGLIAALRDRGLTVYPRHGSVKDGIFRVQELFSKHKLTLDPSCVSSINDLESYIWKEGKEEPVKEFDHAPDAIRYFITREKRIKIATQVRW